ncbi:tRNA (guanosine(46)-N7)-methyltransferase TrmB [Candidatus Peregrinibacteria bacterium]|nr:tRNA (guanosine(46)-N7)-methyltransferase TrmB [Candidatus Peregrinibacteria bacterium]
MGRKKLKHISGVKDFANVWSKMGVESKGADVDRVLSGELVLELGCGHGDYTLALAGKYPEKSFVGVDRKGDRIYKGAGKALEEGTHNVAFIQDKIDNLAEYFGGGSVGEIWLTFPDPYVKPSKFKQRLCSERYLPIYRSILRSGGLVHLKTDNEKLFEFAMEMFGTEGWEILQTERDLHGEKAPILDEAREIRTFYENKYMARGMKIFYLKVARG